MKKNRKIFIRALLLVLCLIGTITLKVNSNADGETVTISFLAPDGKTKLLDDMTVPKGTKTHKLFEKGSVNVVYEGSVLWHWKGMGIDDFDADFGNKQRVLDKDTTFIGIFDTPWGKIPYSIPFYYDLNGGTITREEQELLDVYAGEKGQGIKADYWDSIVFPIPRKSDSIFLGWYTEPEFKTQMTEIPPHFSIQSTTENPKPELHIYAKWEKVVLNKPVISSVKNSSTGKMAITVKKAKCNFSGYDYWYSTKKNFTKDVHNIASVSSNKYTLTNLPKGTTYYVKVRLFRADQYGNVFYGPYSSVKSIKIKKGVTEKALSKVSVKVKSTKISSGKLYVKASINGRIKSSDSFYYLVKVDPYTNAFSEVVSSLEKEKTLKTGIPVRTVNGDNLFEGKYALAIKDKGKYRLISKPSYISNPESAAIMKNAYPTPASKKGRQGHYDKAYGDKHYFNNIRVGDLTASKGTGTPYTYNGTTYYFNKPQFVEELKKANKDGGTTTLQLNLNWTPESNAICKQSIGTNQKLYYAYNMETPEGRKQVEATFNYLAEYYAKQGIHVDNWILGNEVNTYIGETGWYWAGNISRDEFITNYAHTFKTLYYAVTGSFKNSRVFVCVDHTWNDRDGLWGAAGFLQSFASKIQEVCPYVKWNVAYHAYSSVLTNADFWNDNTSNLYTCNNSASTSYVSPLNLDVMVNFVKKLNKDAHIILSEQAFTSVGGSNAALNGGRQSGQSVQAAAMAFLYYKVQFNPNIDAVIFSHTSDAALGDGMDFSIIGKEAENVYKYMDTPSFHTYTDYLLPTIKQSSWSSTIPGFKETILTNLPNR